MKNADAGSPIEAAGGPTLAAVVSVLRELRVPWTLAGALAADRYRASHRYTADTDLLVEWHERLPDRLMAEGLELKIARDDGAVHLIRARTPEGNVDLIIAGTDYQRGAIRRSINGALTVEDVIVHKLIAWRVKDQDDVRSILASGRTFDVAYVERWVHDWDVEDRWRETQGWR